MTIRALSKAYVVMALAIITTSITTQGIQAAQENQLQTTLETAIRFNNVNEVKALLATDAGRAQLNQANYAHCETPLDIAASLDLQEIAEILIQHGARVNCDHGIKGPLHFAAGPNVAWLLITHGANVNAIDGRGLTPLHRTMERKASPKTISTARVLIENGANIDKKTVRQHNPDARGYTPLHMAAQYGNWARARLLVQDYGADIYTGADFDGNQTALYYALTLPQQQSLSKEKLRIAKMLIQHGADLFAKSEWEQTPFDLAPEPIQNKLLKLDEERLQAVQLWAKNLQEQHTVPTDIVRHLLTFALTEGQCQDLSEKE